MARSPIKTASESDVTSAAEETLDFDDDTLRGELKHVCYFPQEVNSIGSYQMVRRHCQLMSRKPYLRHYNPSQYILFLSIGFAFIT